MSMQSGENKRKLRYLDSLTVVFSRVPAHCRPALVQMRDFQLATLDEPSCKSLECINCAELADLLELRLLAQVRSER